MGNPVKAASLGSHVLALSSWLISLKTRSCLACIKNTVSYANLRLRILWILHALGYKGQNSFTVLKLVKEIKSPYTHFFMEETLACTNYLFITGEAKRSVLKTQQLYGLLKKESQRGRKNVCPLI